MSTQAAQVKENAAAAATVTASPQLWGPPFTAPWGFLPFATPTGYWSAVKPDAWNGGWVQQLGANTHPATAPLTQGDLLVGFFRDVDLAPGTHSFLVRLELGPVSLVRRNGGGSDAYVFLQIIGPGAPFVDLRPAISNSVMYLNNSFTVSVKARYRVRFGGYLFQTYQGTQDTYGEIINKRSEVLYYPPYLATQAATLRSAGPDVHLPAGNDKLPAHVFTPEEAAATRELLPPVAF